MYCYPSSFSDRRTASSFNRSARLITIQNYEGGLKIVLHNFPYLLHHSHIQELRVDFMSLFKDSNLSDIVSLKSSMESLMVSPTSSAMSSAFLRMFLRNTVPLYGANRRPNAAPIAIPARAPTMIPSRFFIALICLVNVRSSDVLNHSTATNDSENDGNNCDHQKEMNEAACSIAHKTDCPCNDENHCHEI